MLRYTSTQASKQANKQTTNQSTKQTNKQTRHVPLEKKNKNNQQACSRMAHQPATHMVSTSVRGRVGDDIGEWHFDSSSVQNFGSLRLFNILHQIRCSFSMEWLYNILQEWEMVCFTVFPQWNCHFLIPVCRAKLCRFYFSMFSTKFAKFVEKVACKGFRTHQHTSTSRALEVLSAVFVWVPLPWTWIFNQSHCPSGSANERTLA